MRPAVEEVDGCLGDLVTTSSMEAAFYAVASEQPQTRSANRAYLFDLRNPSR
jgi:hypothetical protein